MNMSIGHILLILLIFIILFNSFLIITYTVTARRNKRMMEEVEKMAEAVKKLKI